MKKHSIIIILILSSYNLSAQSIEDLSFGTDTTFEAMTWNIEWFPKNGQTTANYVSQIIEALDVDLVAIQEVDDTILFKQMINGMNEYEGYFKSSWFAGLAYIYKTDVIEINDIYEIYTTEPYWRAFPRSPMVMELSFMNEDFIIINNHFKCCGDGILNPYNEWDEETRRLDASNLIKQFIDSNFPNKRVIVLGDLNDVLTDEPVNNVFQPFFDDAGNYLFADMNIALGNSSNWSYPTWPSHLDHILVTNELFDELENEGSDIECIRIDDYLSGGWWEYESNISDHRPLALKIKPDHGAGINEINTSVLILSNYPNPFTDVTNIFFNPVRENTKIEIYNSTGQKVYSENIPKGQSSLIWNAESFPNGVYFSILISNREVIGFSKMLHAR
ncbi:MAG: endonuclease/exonuclease/phosphatase family protein [Bacteroidales bacterium]|nr:endonuclease/exonuclease/phosphatase family protein [Bacteroidales bacterium]